MTPARARARAGFLLYAALQFVVLTACAMAAFPGGTWANPAATGYRFFDNFFSDLGATHTFRGDANQLSAVLFSVALATVGAAFIAFTGAWRAFAFARGRARAAGIVGDACGLAAGVAFVGVAVTPINVALSAHNTLVVSAFGSLLGYVAATTVVLWRNGVPTRLLAVAGGYLVVVLVYVAIVVRALAQRVHTIEDVRVMVVAQKGVVYASMLYVIYFTRWVRRTLRS